MAHSSRSNLNITNPIKELVSKNRNRYRQDGFNLDLTYITPKLIAMGFPASKIEGCYRNHIDDVFRMLEQYHRDHYKIYNLCSERSYDPQKFHNRVCEYPFADHNPPRLELIRPFCEDVAGWLGGHELNVAAVHCKAGKGRTGTMICCYLLHSRHFTVAAEALNFYGHRRTQDQKGVTIPSQVRYVHYYARLLQEQLSYKAVGLYLSEIKLEPPPLCGGKQADLNFSIYVSRDSSGAGPMKVYKSTAAEMHRADCSYNVKFKLNVPLMGDVKIELHSKSKMPKKAKLFQFWFNTFFVEDEAPEDAVSEFSSDATSPSSSTTPMQVDVNGYVGTGAPPMPSNKPLMLCLRKHELDIVNKKDKQNKTFSADFKITLYFLRHSPNVVSEWSMAPAHLPHGPSSGSSEASDSDSSVWDSAVECEMNIDPRGVGYTRLLSDCDLSTKQADLHAELLAV